MVLRSNEQDQRRRVKMQAIWIGRTAGRDTMVRRPDLASLTVHRYDVSSVSRCASAVRRAADEGVCPTPLGLSFREATPLKTSSIFGLVFVTVVWGAGLSAVKIGLGYLPPYLYVGIRFSITAVLIAGYMAARGVPLRVPRALWSQMAALIVLFYFQQGLIFLGLTYTHAGRTGVILNTHPLLTALLAHFFVTHDRLSVPKAGGILLALGGVYAIFRERIGDGNGAVLRGDTLILCAAICWSLQTIIVKRIARRVAPSTIVTWQAGVASIVFFATSALFETVPSPNLDTTRCAIQTASRTLSPQASA